MSDPQQHRNRSLRVIAYVSPDNDGENVMRLLRRLDATVEARWPVPSAPAPDDAADVLFFSIDSKNVATIRRYLQTIRDRPTAVIGITDSKDPAILEVISDGTICAVVERPLTAMGLIANFAIARGIWGRYVQVAKDARHYKRRALGDQRVTRAKVILMAEGKTEEQVYAELRTRAQLARVSIETIAEEIISSAKDPSERTT